MAGNLAHQQDTYSVEELAADVEAVIALETAHANIVAQTEPLLARFLAAQTLATGSFRR